MLPIICWDIIVKYAERDASILRSCHKGMNILVDVLNSKLQAHGLEQKNFKEWSYAFSMWKYEVKRKHTEGRKLLPHENRFIQLCISHGIKVLIAQENDSKTLAQDTGTLPVPKKDEPERKKMKLSPGISSVNQIWQKNLKDYLELQKEVIRLNKNCDFITLTEKLEELNELIEDEDSSRLEKCLFIIKHFVEIEQS